MENENLEEQKAIAKAIEASLNTPEELAVKKAIIESTKKDVIESTKKGVIEYIESQIDDLNVKLATKRSLEVQEGSDTKSGKEIEELEAEINRKNEALATLKSVVNQIKS